MTDPAKLRLLTRTADEATFEILEAESGEAYASLRPQKPPPNEWELRQQPLGIDGRHHFVLKNLRNDCYLLLNSQEHFLWQQFDGRSSLDEIARGFHLQYGSFDYALVRELIAKLHYAKLLEGYGSRQPLSNFVTPHERSRWRYHLGNTVGAWRQFAWRIRDADRYCSILYRYGGFVLFHREFFWLLLVIASIAGIACWRLAPDSMLFARLLATQPYLSAATALLTLLGASMLHVLVHALACKAHGRRVRELGFFLLQGVWPAFYADVTDIFMSDRRARLRVDLAGPMVEVALGSLAMLGAYASHPGIGQAMLFVTGFLLWESALINLYPFSFFELDGYNILADAIAMPMLRRQALALLPNLPQRLRSPRTLGRSEIIQIGYLALCFVSVIVYIVLHLDALVALVPFTVR